MSTRPRENQGDGGADDHAHGKVHPASRKSVSGLLCDPTVQRTLEGAHPAGHDREECKDHGKVGVRKLTRIETIRHGHHDSNHRENDRNDTHSIDRLSSGRPKSNAINNCSI